MFTESLKTSGERVYLQEIEGFLKAEVYITRQDNGQQLVFKDYSRFRHNPVAALIARFLVQREYNALSRLQGWVHAPEVFESNDPLILLQEYIPGKAMDSKNAESPEVVKNIRTALRQLHQKDMAHNDFRASNIIVKPDNTVVIIDFTSATHLPKFLGKISRWLMSQDLRHVLKYQDRIGQDLTAREKQMLEKPKALQRLQDVWKKKILCVLKGKKRGMCEKELFN
mgnify:FL=1